MRFPLDLDKEFEKTWAAYLELTAVQDALKINPLAVEDAFRILLIQAGIKTVKTQFNAKRFISLSQKVQQLKKRLDLSHVLRHVNIRKHSVAVDLPTAKQINIVNKPSIEGIVQLKPRAGFTVDYLLQRMASLKVFREIPPRLTSGKFPTILTLKNYDFCDLYRDKEIGLSIARLKGDTLILKYDLSFDTILPAYKDVESQMLKLWQIESRGIFK